MQNRRNKNGNKRDKGKPNDKMGLTEQTEDYSVGDKRDRNKPNKRGVNDLSWYVVDNQVLLDAARIPYNIPVGFPFSREGKLPAGLFGNLYDDSIPGIAVQSVIPTIGNAEFANDAVNVAGNSVFTFVRSKINGSRTYDPVDMMEYIMSVDSVYYWIAHLTRIYATCSLYHEGNRYLPDALITSLGVDASDVRANLAQFRQNLNQRIMKISTLILPAVMPIFRRHSWMFSNYFIEGESVKDQIYCYRPIAYYKFGLDSDGAGMLKAIHIIGTRSYMGMSNLLGVNDLINILDDMIEPIFGHEDFVKMSGDFAKAYEGNILKLAIIPDLLPISVQYSPDVLLQFKNSKCQQVTVVSNSSVYTGQDFLNDMFSIYQDTTKSYLKVVKDPHTCSILRSPNHVLTYGEAAAAGAPAWKGQILQAMWNEWSKDTLLTSPRAIVEPGENMINTRLALAFNVEYDSAAVDHADVYAMAFGSEWPVQTVYYSFHREKLTGITSLVQRVFARVMYIDETTDDPEKLVESYLPIRSAFKYAPELSIIVRDTLDQVVSSGRQFFEVDNYALTSFNVINGLHNTAIQGEYNIPKLAVSGGK